MSPGTLYDDLNKNFGYDVVNTKHTQLWFLPDNHLYEPGNKCAKPTKISDKTESGLPNIEP